MRKLIKYMLRLQFQKWILFLFVALWFQSGFSQGINDINKAFIIGQVTKDLNNAPISGHEVTIMSDTTYDPDFIYVKKVYTDKEGLFYDTIPTKALKGALYIFTHDCFNKIHDTTVYYRFNWDESNLVQANFKLPVELSTNSAQANYKFIQNPLGNNNLLFQFYDNTNSENVISWYWEFGDDKNSTLQNPQHTYSEPGLYHVKLTVVVQDPQIMFPHVSTIVKVVDVKLIKYFHLGGHIKAGYFPIDIGEAYLYKIEEKDYVIVDTAIFNDSLGFYLFPQVIEGQYLVKADLHPSSIYFNEYLQTYYNDKYFWEEADTIFHSVTSTEYDIDLIPNNNEYMAGSGKLTGKIVYDEGQSQSGSKSGAACNIEIILFDQDNQLVEICHSNDLGSFELNQLDLQSYEVYAEVTGKYTIPLNVILEPSTTEIDQITLIISSSLVHGSYTYDITESVFEKNTGNVYPNPVSNLLNLDVKLVQSEMIDISIIDAYGRSVKTISYQGNTGTNNINLNLEELTGGFYFIKISRTSGQSLNRKFLKN